MSTGPKNDFVSRRQQELLADMQPPPMPSFREFRRPPDAREYTRRYQVWKLLEWYEHEVARPNRGLRGFLRRFWYRVTGHKIKLMSPWQQLALRDQWEAENAAKAEAEREAADSRRNGDG